MGCDMELSDWLTIAVMALFPLLAVYGLVFGRRAQRRAVSAGVAATFQRRAARGYGRSWGSYTRPPEL